MADVTLIIEARSLPNYEKIFISQLLEATKVRLWIVAGYPIYDDRPIFDGTGLTGRYDFTLDWSPIQANAAARDNAAPSNDSPSILAALQEQLGLKLVSTKGPAEVIVIDQIERPSEN
jgi:uncharacterized protein (TIGR03435 family)